MSNVQRFAKLLCLCALISVAGGIPQYASAVNFKLGDIDGRFDSSLSIGESWGLQSADPKLIGRGNSGKGFGSAADDGRLNYSAGDAFSKVFKGIHTLELKDGNTGIVIKGKYWYDYALADEDQAFKHIDDHGRTRDARSSGIEFLDTYVYHNYTLDDQKGTVRFGKQILNWGAKSVINPVDVSALYRPGADPREVLIPVNMFYVSQNVTNNLSVDSFYQLDWEKTQLSNCGTYFSAVDFMAAGCNGLPVGPSLNNSQVAKAALDPFGIDLSNEGVFLKRTTDDDPRNSGQWGLSLHWVVPDLATDFRTYYMNYHSRQPYINTIGGPHVTDQGFLPQLCANIGIPNTGACTSALGPSLGALETAYRIGTSEYQATYPEDIHLYGLTFTTNLPSNTVVSGDIAYRPNMPLQINGLDEAYAVLGSSIYSPPVSNGLYQPANNALYQGYQRKPVTQVQLNAQHSFMKFMGADKFTVSGELGAVYVGDLDGAGGIRFGRSAVYGQGELYPSNQPCQTTNGTTAYNCNEKGFTTAFSWGYKLRAAWQYANVLPALTLRPSVSWAQDVSGYAPEPGYSEGAQSVTVALDGDYQHTYTSSLSATSFFGGSYNPYKDRDYLSLSFGVNF